MRIDRQQMQIEQRLDYRVAHESQRSFVLTVPRGVVSERQFAGVDGRRAVDGDAVAGQRVGRCGADALAVYDADGPDRQLFRSAVRYSVPLDWDRKAALPLTIPLVLPADEENSQFGGQQMEFVLSDRATIEPDLEGVDELAEPVAIGSGTTHAYSLSSPDQPFALDAGAGPGGGGLVGQRRADVGADLADAARCGKSAWRCA